MMGLFIIDDNTTTRLTYHDFYNQKENIDVVVVGTSRVHEGFAPAVFDKETGISSFNLGSSSQTLDASYYVIKEAIKKYNIDTIYLSVEFDILTRDIGGQKNTWLVTDYIRGQNKWQFILDVCDPEEWPLMFFRTYRYRNDISWDYCKNNFRAKCRPEFWNYENQNKYYTNINYYVYKGQNYSEKVNIGYDFFAYKDTYSEFDVVSPEKYNDEMINYLIKSIHLCEDNGVDLVLITMPESRFYISQAGKYDLFTQYINELAEVYGISYYDFNLLRDDRFSDDEFMNLDHLTFDGASHFSNILSDLYLDSDSHIFYNSINDSMYEGIIGIQYQVNDAGEDYQYTWNVIDETERDYKYRICGYSADMDLIFESNIQEEKSMMFSNKAKAIVIEVYSTEGRYIGKAKLL